MSAMVFMLALPVLLVKFTAVKMDGPSPKVIDLYRAQSLLLVMQSVWAFTPLEVDFVRWSFHFVFSKDLHRSAVGALSCSLVISSAKLAKPLVCRVGNRIPSHTTRAPPVRPGDRRYPVLCLCQLGQDIPTILLDQIGRADHRGIDHSALNAMSVILADLS